MKALILNSGMGSRMGDETKSHPKCMTKLDESDTILSRQLKILQSCGIEEVVITTGYFKEVLEEYCRGLLLNLNLIFVNNDKYQETNYIYSIYLARTYLREDIILMHGDLVYEESILKRMLQKKRSFMAVSSTLELPEKDFKAVIEEGLIKKVGIEFFDHAVAAQPLYILYKKEWLCWLDEIIRFCENENVNCYAEKAFNEISEEIKLFPYDVANDLCSEIDTMEDWHKIKAQLSNSKVKRGEGE